MGSWGPARQFASEKLNILLVGPRRTGKSSTGNTLLGLGRGFDTRGGGSSTSVSSVIAGRHVTVVDAQGWGSSEEAVPREEKVELLRALDLCGLDGPHVVLMVIPLLDFTESERRAVERRMEILTSAVWRHTLVVFTFGDRLKERGLSVQEHIQSGGPALLWLMDKCRYRYHVLDNKTAAIAQKQKLKQVVNGDGRIQERSWWRRHGKGEGGNIRGGEADGEREQEQVTELLSKLEDMMQENGAWHFSLHMYQRLEEEWSRRELRLRARLQEETDVGSVKRKQKAVEAKINVERDEEQLDTEVEEGAKEVWGGSLGREQEKKEEECVRRKLQGEGDKEERGGAGFKRHGSGEDEEELGFDSTGGNRKIRNMAKCWPDGSQKSTLGPIRGLA